MARKNTKNEPTAVPMVSSNESMVVGAPEANPYSDEFRAVKPKKTYKDFQEQPFVAEQVEAASDGFDIDHDPLVVAAASNDRRQLLIALRDKLARSIAVCNSGRDIASMSLNLNKISKELSEMPDPDAAADDPVEQLRAKVQAKQSE